MNAKRPHIEADAMPHGKRSPTFRKVRLHALAGIVIAPIAWLVQMGLTEALAAQSCFPHDRPLHGPAMPRLVATIVAVDIVCLLLGCLGAYLGWRNVLQLRREQALSGSQKSAAQLNWVLAYVGGLSSALFLFALVATDIAVLIISPCSAW